MLERTTFGWRHIRDGGITVTSRLLVSTASNGNEPRDVGLDIGVFCCMTRISLAGKRFGWGKAGAE
jgi:hypothetical protein